MPSANRAQYAPSGHRRALTGCFEVGSRPMQRRHPE
jgi:hypothetical protein